MSFLISSDCTLKLPLPVVGVSSGDSGILATGVLVPKAAVDKYNCAVPRHYDVWLARQIWYVKSKAVTQPMHS